MFPTASDNQMQVVIRVLPDECEMDSKLLGEFDIIGILPAPKATPQIKVAAAA